MSSVNIDTLNVFKRPIEFENQRSAFLDQTERLGVLGHGLTPFRGRPRA